MDDQWSDELRTLRARAYGPTADIHDDPTALARLRELEGRAQTIVAPAAPATPAAPVPAVPQEGDAVSEPEPEGEASVPEQIPATHDVAAASPVRRRRRLWPWIATAVGVGLVVGAVVATLVPAVLPANRVAVLATADLSEWDTDAFGPPQEGSILFHDFRDLSVVMIPNAWGLVDEESATRCLFVHSARGVMITIGCAGDGFSPTASFTVRGSFADELGEEFPDGTSLRFVLDGSEVLVYARRP
jgi:hypothetical protein